MPTKPPAPSDIADKFMLRLPDGMRDRLAEVAKANNRSMNAEIISRLEASFAGRDYRVDLTAVKEEDLIAIAREFRAIASEVLGLSDRFAIDEGKHAPPNPTRKPKGKVK